MEENRNQQIHDERDPVTNDKFVKDHEFDGIRELDNDPPSWLNILFVITVLIAYAYLAKYHLFKTGDLQEAEYQKEMVKYMPKDEGVTDSTALAVVVPEVYPLTDPARLADGQKIFATNCVVCHLAQAQGLVGPNLTDEYWIHGGSYDQIVATVSNGVLEKGMIAWKNQLSKRQINNVVSYMLTLQGSNPPNPKAPEGVKYVP